MDSKLREIGNRIKNLEILTSLIHKKENGLLGFKAGDISVEVLKETNNAQVFRCLAEKGDGMKEHVHEAAAEHFIIIKGKIEITINGKSKIYGVNEHGFIPPFTPHSVKILESTTYICIVIPPESAYVGIGN